MQCQRWHIAEVLNAIITLDNAWMHLLILDKLLDFKYEHIKDPSSWHPVWHTHEKKHIHHSGDGCSAWEFENTTWTNGLFKASTLTFWISEGVGWRGGHAVFMPLNWVNHKTHNQPYRQAQPRAIITGVCPHQASWGDPSNQPGAVIRPPHYPGPWLHFNSGPAWQSRLSSGENERRSESDSEWEMQREREKCIVIFVI